MHKYEKKIYQPKFRDTVSVHKNYIGLIVDVFKFKMLSHQNIMLTTMRRNCIISVVPK